MKKSWSASEFTLKEARSEVRDWLWAEELDHLEQDVSLIVTELLSNASDAAADGDPVELELQRKEGEILVAVSNRGDIFSLTGSMPPAESARGRGLSIVNALSRSVEVRSSGRLTTIYAVVGI